MEAEGCSGFATFMWVKEGEMRVEVSALGGGWMWPSWPKHVSPPFILHARNICLTHADVGKGGNALQPLCPEASLQKAWNSFLAEVGICPCRNRALPNRRSLKVNAYVFGLENTSVSLDPPARREHADPLVWPDNCTPSFP